MIKDWKKMINSGVSKKFNHVTNIFKNAGLQIFSFFLLKKIFSNFN